MINNSKEVENTEIQKRIKFLKNKFNCEYNVLTLPKKELKNNSNDLMKHCSLIINEDQYEMLNCFIKSFNLLPKSFFLGIYGYIMYKYSSNEIVYTSIINELKNDLCKNENVKVKVKDIQPFLMKFEKNNKFIDILKEINEDVLFYENFNIQYSEVSKELNLINVNNLFIFVCNDKQNSFENNDSSFLYNKYKFDIVFKVVEKNNHYSIHINYNDLFYDDFIIKNILDSYYEVIKNMDNFDGMINDIEYISLKEKNKILKKFNDNKFDYEVPNKCALIFGDRKFTYRELDEMSNSLAYYLRNNGIQRNDIVPLLCDRSYYFVVGALSVMKAGGAFLYIDPEFPVDRIQYMVEEVKAKLILEYVINENNNKILLKDYPVKRYQLEKHNYNKNITEITNINNEKDLSCMFFTSGTTGKPKGALITHDNLVNLCYYGFSYKGAHEIISFESTIAF
eukprot:jgi/Orpsp1_1/1180792/evm.model.c7180000074641.1